MSFDYSRLMESADGDEELARELIGIFNDECPGMLNRIEQAVRSKQPQQLHEAAHALKGPLANLGAKASLDYTVALETMGMNEDLQQVDVALERLKSEIENLIRDTITYAETSVE